MHGEHGAAVLRQAYRFSQRLRLGLGQRPTFRPQAPCQRLVQLPQRYAPTPRTHQTLDAANRAQAPVGVGTRQGLPLAQLTVHDAQRLCAPGRELGGGRTCDLLSCSLELRALHDQLLSRS